MSKRFLLLALALALMVPVAQATQNQMIASAKSNLTEVYGYTAEEAEAFEFEDNRQGLLRFWEKAHPTWVYTLEYDSSSGEVLKATSPFYQGGFSGFPGEASIRDVLNLAKEQKWFSNWNKAAMDALAQGIAEKSNIKISLELAAGLQAGDITPSQALAAFFDSCYGEESQRQPAANEWLLNILAEYGLQREARYQPKLANSVVLEVFPGEFFVYTSFTAQVPESIKPAFSHPKLEGWTCISGAMIQQQKPEAIRYDTGLAIFEKDNRHLLVMMNKAFGEDWQVLPVREQAASGIGFSILPESIRSLGFVIEHQLGPNITQRFHVNPTKEGRTKRAYCFLYEYHYIDQNTGITLQAKNTREVWSLTETPNANGTRTWSTDGAMFIYMETIPGFGNMPTSLAAWQALPQRLTPEGYAMLAGVRLREKTSTRSRELGDFLPGTLINDLGREDGNPAPWLKGSIGLLNGYVSTEYVNQPEGEYGDTPAWTRPLPVARAIADTKLRSSFGLLPSDGADLPKGSKMHVLTEQGDWLYVCVPRGELGWLMDVDGTYGYVHRNDIVIAATAIQLDWIADN